MEIIQFFTITFTRQIYCIELIDKFTPYNNVISFGILMQHEFAKNYTQRFLYHILHDTMFWAQILCKFMQILIMFLKFLFLCDKHECHINYL